MKNIIVSLETITNAVEKDADALKTEQAITLARNQIENISNDPLLKELDLELSVWQSKLSVIMKEPVGKKGMAKHARFWAERLKSLN